MNENSPSRRTWRSRRSEAVSPTHAPSPTAAEREQALRDQMIVDWSARGLRRIEALLSRHAAFGDYLDASGDER